MLDLDLDQQLELLQLAASLLWLASVIAAILIGFDRIDRFFADRQSPVERLARRRHFGI